MPRVTADGVSLAVHEWPGTGPAVVCIHGLTANHVCWQSMADALVSRYRLIGYDLRGRGDSDKPPTGYSLDQHGRDLAALLNHFGLRKAVLMGHSLGAHIALKFAVAHPQRVSKLVLVDGGLDVRAEIIDDSLGPAINRLGVEFPSLGSLAAMRLPNPSLKGTCRKRHAKGSLEELLV